MAHACVTVAVPFDGKNVNAVNAALDKLGNLAQPPISSALDASAFVHFMSLTAVPDPAGGSAHLVMEVSADGCPGDVIDRLAREIGHELGNLLAIAGVEAPENLSTFLARHDNQVGQGWFATTGLAFTGTPGMTVRRIRQEADLAAWIKRFIEQLPLQDSALAKLRRVREQLFSEGSKWAFVAEPVPAAEAPKGYGFVVRLFMSALTAFFWPLFVLPGLFLLMLAWQGLADPGFWRQGLWGILVAVFWGGVKGILALGAEIVLVGIAAWFAYKSLRRHEKMDVPDDSNPSTTAVDEIMVRENKGVQNHLMSVSVMKPGWTRRLALRLVLWAVGALAEYRSRPGFLGDVGSIHFARWIKLPRTDKLLFFSNYTGSWESYLEDFIVKLHYGLTGIWSNTEGFPRTNNLVLDGAEDGDRFKRWGRRQQLPTRFWYVAYPHLTTDRVRINAAIRNGFATASTEEDAERWLVGFDFAPPRDSEIQFDRIPTLVFSGLAALPCARSLVLQLPDTPADARAWLADIEPDIAYGERISAPSTLVLGLSESGLRKLGLDQRALATFPTAFQDGMAAPWRSRALGDVGSNDPNGWSWGGPHTKADAILNLYARSKDTLEQEAGQRAAQLEQFGIRVIHEILLDELPPKGTEVREPFGFSDGISQPIVRGARKWVIQRNQIHVVEPGEMILGYPDNFAHKPPLPSLGGRDVLGCNGTYLVVRQLEQDTNKFSRFLAVTAEGLVGDPRVPHVNARELADWIGAKIVGRWRDGTSLVRHPDQPGSVSRPGTPPDNDFLYGTEDPDGLRCPFGAHLRRVNPRESFNPNSQEQLAVSNRHRIFRVGRSYAPQNEFRHPGLLFMCVNANIERQFEFTQQTYMLGSSLHGLENEVDAFARRQDSSDVITIPTESGPLHLTGLATFVTVRGGGYFFMPGRDAVSLLVRGS